MATSLETYRALVPGHAVVPDATVLAFLEAAAQAHGAGAWGAVYVQAMIWYAAHAIETTPGTGVGNDSGDAVGPIVSQKDGDLSRTYAAPAGMSSGSSADMDLASTRYGQAYLRLRASRAATSPMRVGP